ncbi:MAG TPA: J domain-containing protein, partial [Polyangiaceae bacterium]|nr:J domain-containing protein [Polyangiaceae bacterium]
EPLRTSASNARSSIPDVEHIVPSQRPSGAHPAVPSAPPLSPAAPPPLVSLPPMPLSAPPAADQASPAPRLSTPSPERRISSPFPKSSLTQPPEGGASLPQFLGSGTADQRLELEALTARLVGTHYEALGVPADAPTAVIQGAFFALAKKWHPDRLRPEVADLKDQASRVFARLSQANQILSDTESRQLYDKSLATPDTDEEAEQVHKVLKATNAFQKAEVLLKRGNLAPAEKEAIIAFENDPSQADHIALHAWIQAQKPSANLTDLAVQLEKAAKAEPNNLRVRWYRGQLLKRLGRAREALLDFRFIAERDARHTDAHREVRLYQMRRGARPPSDPPGSPPSQPAGPESQRSNSKSIPAAKPGLLNKLFKKP